ncbi:hypothetical protein [Williamsoniiplasma lucivorax]|uniref:Uncharacterized protein n=1 Tax=Williamsoniiplasma lucivorax TaxID=209274 RepID=A0A2S5RCS8_9MOLU|nr:hypothetical protein [Williamsoniiplasma lucivorax]PPE05141.1 hypothetical protein ELUCI_v1c06770 [Williamsoniiplasma lucivorax]
MKKLLGLLSTFVIGVGSVATVAACGIRIEEVIRQTDISNIVLAPVKINPNLEVLKAKIQKKIEEKIPGTKLGVDYTIDGSLQQTGFIRINATISSKLIKGYFPIMVTDNAQKNIAMIGITNLKIGDSKADVYAKIHEQIQLLYPDAELNQDYQIAGLEQLLQNDQIAFAGAVHVTGISDYLSGGFVLSIYKSNSTTTPLGAQSPQPGKITNISTISMIDVKVGDTQASVLDKIHQKIREFYPPATITKDYQIAGLDQLVVDGKVAFAGRINIKTTGKYLTGGFVLVIRQLDSTTQPLGDNPAAPTKLTDISSLSFSDIKIGLSKNEVLQKVFGKIQQLHGQAKLDQDYQIVGLDQLVRDEKIAFAGIVHLLGIGDYLTGGVVIRIYKNNSTTDPIPPHPNPPSKLTDISQIQINDVKVNESKISVLSKIQKQISEFYPQAQINQDYQVHGLDDLVQEDKIAFAGSIHIKASGNVLTGGFVLTIRQGNSTTKPLTNQTNPPGKAPIISDVTIGDIKIGDSQDQVEAKILEKLQALYPDAKLNQDYQIQGLEQLMKDGQIAFSGTIHVVGIGDHLTGGMEITIDKLSSTSKPLGLNPTLPMKWNDISNIQIYDVKVNDTKLSVLAKIQKQIAAIFTKAKINQDYQLDGLDQLIEGDKIAFAGNVHIKAFGNDLTGGFILFIRQTDSITKPLAGQTNPPGKMPIVSDVTINDIKIGDTKAQVDAKILQKLQTLYPHAKLNQDYQIQGLEQLMKDDRIVFTGTIHVVGIGDHLTGGMEITIDKLSSTSKPLGLNPTPPTKLINISNIKIHDVKVSDVKQTVLNKIDHKISEFYPQARINRDYKIEGLDDLVQEDKIAFAGIVHIKALGKHLTGGFVLAIHQTGSTTEVLTPNSAQIGKLISIDQIEIKDIKIGNLLVDVKAKIAAKIQTLYPDAQLNQDYQIESLEALIQGDQIAWAGQINVHAIGNHLTGGVAISINKTGSTTNPITPNTPKPGRLTNISDIKLADVYFGDAVDRVLAKIQNQISQIYENATLDKDYQIDGLNELVRNGKINDYGNINIKAIGDNLTGGFALWILQSGAITEPLGSHNALPTRLKTISQIVIDDINKNTSMEVIRQKVQAKIAEIVPGTQLDVDYNIVVDSDQTISVFALLQSRLIKDAFEIKIKKSVVEADLNIEVYLGDTVTIMEIKIEKILEERFKIPATLQSYRVPWHEVYDLMDLKEYKFNKTGIIHVKGIDERLPKEFTVTVVANPNPPKQPPGKPPGKPIVTNPDAKPEPIETLRYDLQYMLDQISVYPSFPLVNQLWTRLRADPAYDGINARVEDKVSDRGKAVVFESTDGRYTGKLTLYWKGRVVTSDPTPGGG